jgi:MYXO-CTERM domain-containing protein
MADDAWDWNAKTFPATDTHPHPDYWGLSDHDFCLFTISGTDDSTPVIPAMTPEEDSLKVGDMVEFVGYGVTESDYNNSERRHVSDDISGLTKGMMSYDQNPGGPCNGDSGGPALSKVGGGERVSGVTSQGDSWCVEYGESGRVSSVYDSFIKPYLGSCVPTEGGGSSGSSSSSSSGGSTSGGASDPGTGSSGAGGHPGGSSGAGASNGAGGGEFVWGSGDGGSDTGDSDDDDGWDGENSDNGLAPQRGGCAFRATARTEARPFGLAGALGLAAAGLRRRRRR